MENETVEQVFADFITQLYKHLGIEIPDEFYPDIELAKVIKRIVIKEYSVSEGGTVIYCEFKRD